MEIIPEGKNFRLVQENELPKILEVLEQYLPEALKFHQTVKTYLNNRVWQFYFYVSKNWPEEPICLHFPGCTLTPNKRIYESFGIFCPSDQLENIDLLKTEDILIDWTEPLYLNFTHIDIMNRLETFYSTHGKIDKLIGDIYICKGPPDKLELENLPSDEVEMRPLAMENVKAIHDLYPASEIECVEVFENLVKSLPGFGIFSVETGELAAWMVQSYYGAMCSMQTKPEFRRKGYGIHLAQALTKLVVERGYLPFVVIRPENDASRSLYIKLGFERAFGTVRAILKPHQSDDTTMNGKHDIRDLIQQNGDHVAMEGGDNNNIDGDDDDGGGKHDEILENNKDEGIEDLQLDESTVIVQDINAEDEGIEDIKEANE